MNSLFRAFCAAMALWVSPLAFGQTPPIATLANVTIVRFGVNNSPNAVNQNKAYLVQDQTFPTGVSCGIYSTINFEIATTTGRALYLEVLAAKMTGKRLSRIDFTYASGLCTLVFVEVSD